MKYPYEPDTSQSSCLLFFFGMCFLDMRHLHLPNPKQTEEQNTLCLLWAKSLADRNQIHSTKINIDVIFDTDWDSDLLHWPLPHLRHGLP